MTGQIKETLIYRKRKWRIDSYPLNDYFQKGQKDVDAELIQNPFARDAQQICSACWNCYVASWEIEDKSLYLKSILTDWEEDFTTGSPLGKNLIEVIFPGAHQGKFADWYSGEIEALPLRGASKPIKLVFSEGELIEEWHGLHHKKWMLD